MNLEITPKAASFYKQEMDLQKGDTLRLYVRVGGVGSGGFSVGIMRDDDPSASAYVLERESITFFVTEDDFWYLDEMMIDYDEDLDMVVFNQPRFDDLHHPLAKQENEAKRSRS
ncbi:iron-sulfur cluster biosynthesis family protein [Shouchella shacheensis]|uniref:iron-sulfur cluster biosynthesis family protein n=1 Tax=Shouchella shacheensis TaxID=1649580 RepID=UPI0007401438|nr:iron-sulfur cluster biosynthesis family protein [Shouchella shacheensis]